MAIKAIPHNPKLKKLILETMQGARNQEYTPELLCERQKIVDAQHYYWWCMDMKKEEWAADDLFTEDFRYYCFGPQKVTGREQAERSKHVNELMATTHMGHQPLVWFMSETTARAIFMYEDHNLYTDDSSLVQSWAVYIDDFVKKENGKWYMNAERLSYIKMSGSYRL